MSNAIAEQQFKEFRATDHGKSFFIPTTLFHDQGFGTGACGDGECGIKISPTPAQETKHWVGIHRCKRHADMNKAERHEFSRLKGVERQVKDMLKPLLERLS